MTKKTCGHCGDQFIPKFGQEKYCGPDCAYNAKLRKGRVNRGMPFHESAQALAELKASRPAPVQIKRATSLAETPDVPAVTAMRGDYLTGGASAGMQAVSGGRNLAHG